MYSDLFSLTSKANTTGGLSARTALCLPVSVETLLDARSRDGKVKYFVVDCRSLREFDNGHLPQAWHLDAQLMLSSPAQFSSEVSKLEDAINTSGHQPCFLGSGNIEVDGFVGKNNVMSHFCYIILKNHLPTFSFSLLFKRYGGITMSQKENEVCQYCPWRLRSASLPPGFFGHRQHCIGFLQPRGDI